MTGYDSPSKKFTVTYQKQWIHKDGDEWWEDIKAEQDPIPDIAVETVDKGIKLYNKKYSDVKDFI